MPASEDRYTVYYFPIKGLGEGIRLVLAYLGKDFEDRRVTNEEWPELKKQFINGAMPVLKINDDKELSQSFVIGRYLANKYDFAPKDPWERVRVEELLDSSNPDLSPKLYGIMAYEDKEKRLEKLNEMIETFLKPRMKLFNDHLGSTKSGYLASELCYGDLMIYNYFDLIKEVFKLDFAKDYPNIAALCSKVENLDQIKAWHAAHKDVVSIPPEFKKMLWGE